MFSLFIPKKTVQIIADKYARIFQENMIIGIVLLSAPISMAYHEFYILKVKHCL